jgi:hypothetical protein
MAPKPARDIRVLELLKKWSDQCLAIEHPARRAEALDTMKYLVDAFYEMRGMFSQLLSRNIGGLKATWRMNVNLMLNRRHGPDRNSGERQGSRHC